MTRKIPLLSANKGGNLDNFSWQSAITRISQTCCLSPFFSHRAKNKSEGIRHFSKHYNKPAKKFQDYRVPVEFLRSFTPQIILKIGKIELKNMISDIQGVPTSLDFSIHFLNPNNNVCLMVRQNCQNWHLSVVLLWFFVVSSHVDDGLLQSNVSSQFSVGNGAHVREKAAPAHGAS